MGQLTTTGRCQQSEGKKKSKEKKVDFTSVSYQYIIKLMVHKTEDGRKQKIAFVY